MQNSKIPTLSHEDSEEIGKGINAVSNNRLNEYDNGFGRVNLLSGWMRRYQVGFGSATRCAPVNPLGRSTGRLGHAGRARGEAG
jgi:hypothetical protein